MLQLFGEVFWSISTTTPNTIHQRLPSWFNGALFCWAWLEMTFFNELGSNSLHKTCDLASAFRQGCQIAKFTKCKKVGKYSFAQTSIAAVLRSCSNFKQQHCADPCPKRVFCWPAGNVRGQCERPRPTTHFFEDTPNVKHNACEMVQNSGENEESHIERPQNHLCFRSKRLFHLGAKMWPRISVNPSNIKANGAQIIYPQIEFPSCTFPELATAVSK